ncbi:phage tail spike protein [Leuconostoc lactis]|uniref:phage tail spike protein n=1 Tax=Leuconostoc lactis TaxID=1246 RepID=UPI00164683B2|nr:phage tail spike protein [Leuconostoc lactis]
MTPILYEKDEIDFTSQGLGSLAEIYDADVAEQRNGLLQLTASYPVTGVRYDDISVGRIILAKPNQRDEPHAFRITSTDLDIMGHNVMIEADSITYDLNHNIVKHLNVSGADGQTMMSALKNAIVNPSIFNFYSDINHVSGTSLDYVNPMEAVMGVKGSFLQIWGGELKRENRRVAMFNRRGRDNVATFRLGKNISGLKYKVDISSLVTRILPIKSVQENDTTTYLEGTPVSSQYINSYEQIYTIKVDFTDDTIKTVDDLNKASANWFVDSANTARDKPSVTIDIDVLSLQDSADYQDKFKDLESVALTDTVTVYVPEYGINVTAIVNELHFDPIQERVTKLTVGTARMSFADSSRVQLSDLQDKVISVQEQANQTAISANGKNTNYYGSVEPSHPQAGDLWYWKNGDLSGIKQFINGEWADWVDSNTQQHIIDSVDQALTEAKAYSDQLVADNVAQVNTVLDDVQAKQADLTAQQAELDTKAQGYANKALADAKANTLATATQTAKDASDALAKAKTDLTTSLNKEVTDRANAVTALDTKAKGYADTAKADAIATANGAVAKEVTDRQKAITDLDAKSTGAINQAKTDAQSALDALQVGGRNLVIKDKLVKGWMGDGVVSSSTSAHAMTTDFVAVAPNSSLVAQIWYDNTQFDVTNNYLRVAFYDSNKTYITRTPLAGTGSTTYNKWLITTPANTAFVRMSFDWLGDGYGHAKLEIGNKATDYTQAPEDIVLDYTTKDNVISQSLTQYQATNDGKVTKAQSDATQALGLVATKVSQTDYNTKTGDLDSKYTAVKLTADQASTDIVAIKKTNTDQDTRMTTIESNANGTKTTVSNLQTDLGKANGSITTLQQRADGFDATVTKVNTQLNDLSQVNMVVNSEFSPDLAGWYIRGTQTLLSDGPNSSDVGLNKSGHVVLDTTNGTGTGNVNYTSMAYPVTPSSIISVSVELKASVSGTNPQIGFIYYDANMNAVAGQRGGVPVTTDYKLCKYTGTAIPATAKYVSFDILISNVYKAKYVISQPMMVIGSTVGAYVQGQYNNNGATAKAQLTADQATTSLNSYKTDADGRISKAQADIIVNANAITQKVSQSDYNAKTGDLTTKVNTAQSTADSATSTIGSYKQTNDARVASAESKITANANAITQKVSQTDYNTKTGQIDGQISTINQTATNISQSVADVNGRIDSISVGGTNLLLGTQDFTGTGTDRWVLGGTIVANAYQGLSAVQSTSAWSGPKYQESNLVSRWGALDTTHTFTLSEWVRNTSTTQVDIKFYGDNVQDSGQTVVTLPANSDWVRISAQFKFLVATPASGARIRFEPITGVTGGYVQHAGMKLESGTLATSYSPAPEDTDNKISTVSQTVDSISSIVSDPTTGLTKRVQTAEGSISTVQSNVSDLQSKQTQTANGLTTEISNRATGDTNTLTQAKDFTTSSISNSESGMRSLITQTSDSIIAKVDTKTDSATVLSLLRDNWSIGIADNAGAITNGIVGNSTNMSLISNNVTISSPQTQIKGTAWINSAMIGNGQIGNAQIGDAAITSAKIANLDVSKITGNVTNFIQSNWNGVYESTTITNDGMQIVTSDITTNFGPRGIKLTQGGESVGGIGVSSYVGMPTNFQGIAFNLDGTGDYMTWSARDSGVTTGDYTTKLAWFRSSYKPSGQNEGFNFSSDSPVTFWGNIYGRENTEPLKIASFGMHGVSAGGIGHGNGSSAITFGGDGEIYIVSGGRYYKLAQFVKALQPLIGLGTWSAPKNINSSGVVTQWTNITT